MNNSIVKLEDFELDEISGGSNKTKVKQVAKKAGAYAIKGTVSAVLGFGGVFLTLSVDNMLKDGSGMTPIDKLYNSLPGKFQFDDIAIFTMIVVTEALSFVAGWKIGGWLCKKIGLED